ncbi:DUF2303 family protein [Sphingopyxis flava]|uniref:Uncharacterized conserved protein n=1 Tax=Sphingopyxis flava TaxID=1507287 RepID=A0A1T5ACJ1_9SPHN|nr:DUF2303 family protein [Sphingopyxis flava]SKB32684.1 Uncharacterized conserved protein [Sphingopyxis flava]
MSNEDDAPESAGAEEPSTRSTLTGNGEGTYRSESHAHHDHIVDRTGELMEASFKAAENFVRAGAMLINDPITGISVPFVQARGGLNPIRADQFADYRDAPLRVRGTAVHTRLDSFIDHVNRFKGINTALFAIDNPATPKLSAVFDYHGDTEEALEPGPAFAQHRAEYSFPLSEEWQAWREFDGKKMDMAQFAEFLENRIVDVEAATPLEQLSDATRDFINATGARIATPSKLIELSRGLRIYENSVVKDARNLSTGEAQIAFESEHTDGDGKPLNIPNMFIICIPVFARSDVFYRIAARLRYRKGAGIQFWFDLWRTDRVFTDAFDEALDQVREKTACPLFVGVDEGEQSTFSNPGEPAPVF